MTGAEVVDIWAAAAAGVAACAVALRRYMLKPGLGEWATAPPSVQWALAALSISLAMNAITICSGGHASPREAAMYSVLAVVSLVMLRNLHRNGRAGAEVTQHQMRSGIVTTFQMRDPADAEAFGRGRARRRT